MKACPEKLIAGKSSQDRILFSKAARKRCSENNCCLGLQGISNYKILKGEIVLPNKKACDCIIFHDTAVPHVVLVELKRGLVKPGQIEEKFKNTLEWVSMNDERVCGRTDCRVVLLLLHGRGISKSDHATLRSHMFEMRGRRHILQVLPCNTQPVDLYKRTTLRGK